MRLPLSVHGSLAAAPLLFGMLVLPSAANAQSFFETLFGGQKPTYQNPNRYPGAQRLLPPNGGVNAGEPYILRPALQPRHINDDDVEGGSSSKSSEGRGGGHHTVCVRTCDGFYWPVSYSAPRSRFYRDANVCKSSCGSEAKLFHYPTNGGKIEEAVDLSGLSYSRLPAAFKYRKTLIKGCTCKPEPWSEAEIDRHRIYALNEEAAKGGSKSAGKVAVIVAPPMSGPAGDAKVTDATEFTATPAPPKTNAADPPPEAAAPTPKSARAKTADAAAGRGRQRPAAIQPPARIKAQPPQTASSGFWGGGASKYAWPGDAPVRVR